MKEIITYYEILEIEESATHEEIKAAYRILAQIYHPDKIQSNNPRVKQKGNEKLQQINEAYEVLSNPEKKRQYDGLLKEHRDSQAKSKRREDTESATTSGFSVDEYSEAKVKRPSTLSPHPSGRSAQMDEKKFSPDMVVRSLLAGTVFGGVLGLVRLLFGEINPAYKNCVMDWHSLVPFSVLMNNASNWRFQFLSFFLSGVSFASIVGGAIYYLKKFSKIK